MSKGSGTTRGDRRRNARRERLRSLLPRDGAVVGIDQAEEKQAFAVVDHDVRVLARKTIRVKAFRLGEALEVPPQAARTIAALLTLREHVIGPILARVRSPRMGRKPAIWTTVDRRYESLRVGMQELFRDLGITTAAA